MKTALITIIILALIYAAGAFLTAYHLLNKIERMKKWSNASWWWIDELQKRFDTATFHLGVGLVVAAVCFIMYLIER